MARIAGVDIPREKRVEVALDRVAPVDELTQAVDLLFGEVTDARVGVDVRLGQDLLAGRQADPIDVRERHFDALLTWDIDTGDACHRLPLPLLVLGIGADDHHGAMATDDFAVVAACLDGSSDLQRFLDRYVRVVLT